MADTFTLVQPNIPHRLFTMAGQDWNNISWNNFVFFVTCFSSSFSSLHCAYGLVMFTMDGDVQLPVKICYGFGLHKNIWRYHRVSLKMVQLKLQSGVLQPCLIVLTSNKCNHTLLTVSDIFFFSLNFLYIAPLRNGTWELLFTNCTHFKFTFQ